LRSYLHLQEWAMTEVYLLGITITVIKMGDSTQISYHPGVFCFGALVLVTLATSTAIDRELFWQRIDNNRLVMPEQEPIAEKPTTAACEGLISCTTCTKLVPSNTDVRRCPRCGSTIRQRKTASVVRTWALVMTAAIFLVPANIFPIMEVDFLGIPSRSTIIDGIIGFFHKGNYGIGLIILIASVLVPLLSIIGLSILLMTTRPCKLLLLQQRPDVPFYRLYRSLVDAGYLCHRPAHGPR